MAQDIEKKDLNNFVPVRDTSATSGQQLASPELQTWNLSSSSLSSYIPAARYKLAALEKGKLAHAYGFKPQILEMDSSWICI